MRITWTIKIIKAISTRGLTGDLINKFTIFNGAKYLSSIIFSLRII